jgi:hypothetical protein
MTPKIRQILYLVSAIASALIPLLVTYKVLDPSSGTAWINLVGILGALGGTGAATAAVMTSRQRKDGTLEFSGTPAEQAIEAIKATVAQAGTARSDLQELFRAVSKVIPVALDAAKPVLVDMIPAPTDGDDDPASANYQP